MTAASVRTASTTAPSRMRRLSFTHLHPYPSTIMPARGFPQTTDSISGKCLFLFILGGTTTAHFSEILFMGLTFPIPVGGQALELNAQSSAEVPVGRHKDHSSVSG